MDLMVEYHASASSSTSIISNGDREELGTFIELVRAFPGT